MENQLNEYSDLTNRYIENNNLLSTNDFGKLDSIKDLIPSAKIRITVLDLAGRVLYDNSVENYSEMENHLDRPEVQKAKYADRGYNIRHSVTTKQDYFYFAKFYKTIFIRSAVEYNAEVINYLKVERAFIIYLLFLFAIFGLILRLVANRLETPFQD